MKIFLSYSSRDTPVAKDINLALEGSGHQVFFDKSSLPPAGDYHARIRSGVDDSDAVVFLISPDSVKRGCYALTELKFAQQRWPHPAGRVMPVIVRPTVITEIPPYLRAVTILEPEGNMAGEVADAARNLLGADSTGSHDRKEKILEAARENLITVTPPSSGWRWSRPWTLVAIGSLALVLSFWAYQAGLLQVPQRTAISQSPDSVAGTWHHESGVVWDIKTVKNSTYSVEQWDKGRLTMTGSGILKGEQLKIEYVLRPSGVKGNAQFKISADGHQLSGKSKSAEGYTQTLTFQR